MATELLGPDISLVAAAALTAKQHHIAKVSGDLGCTYAAANTDPIVGVIQNKPASGAAATVRVSGISKLEVAGTIGVGAHITSDSAGKGIATTTDGDMTVGIALEAGATGRTITVLVRPISIYVA